MKTKFIAPACDFGITLSFIYPEPEYRFCSKSSKRLREGIARVKTEFQRESTFLIT
jgi:hypothetical protein